MERGCGYPIQAFPEALSSCSGTMLQMFLHPDEACEKESSLLSPGARQPVVVPVASVGRVLASKDS